MFIFLSKVFNYHKSKLKINYVVGYILENGVLSFSMFISILTFTYLFIRGLCTLPSTNNCNFKMNNSSDSLYPESAYLKANTILCVRTGSLCSFAKGEKKM